MPVNVEPDLPYFREGDPISATMFNRLVDLVAKLRVTAAPGLEAQVTPGGTKLRAVPTASSKMFLVTAQIGGASAPDTPGKGKGTMLVFDPATGKFVATATTNITIYNITTVKIVAGAYVQCSRLDSEWFYDVTACGNGA